MRHAGAQTCPNSKQPANDGAAGFTLLEIIVVISGIALLIGIVMPNLASMVPSARLDGSAKEIKGALTMIRSEARIQAKRMELEIDIDKGRFRTIYPPEERLTTDQIIIQDKDLSELGKQWIDLEPGIKVVGAGDGKSGIAERGMYRVVFDEYGFSADQVIALTLDANEDLVWSVVIRGLTGKISIEQSEEGEIAQPAIVGEGAF